MRSLVRSLRLALRSQLRAAPQCSRRGARRSARAARLPPAAAGGKRWEDELRELAEERQSQPQPPPRTRAAAAPRLPPLSIVMYPSPVLRAANADVTSFDAELAQLARAMFNIMYRTDGVGLAAPQVGINRRLMVYNPEGQPGLGVETVLCNPSIVEWSAEQELFEEGCLSFPGIYADVMIAYQDIRGAKKRMSLDGFQARIFQHEFDHLQGVLYCDRMAPDVLASVEPQLAELRAEWEAGGGAPAAP